MTDKMRNDFSRWTSDALKFSASDYVNNPDCLCKYTITKSEIDGSDQMTITEIGYSPNTEEVTSVPLVNYGTPDPMILVENVNKMKANIVMPNQRTFKLCMPYVKKVIYDPPATIVYWADGSKTIVKAHGDDEFSEEHGLAMAIAKRYFHNRRCDFLKEVENAKRVKQREKPAKAKKAKKVKSAKTRSKNTKKTVKKG